MISIYEFLVNSNAAKELRKNHKTGYVTNIEDIEIGDIVVEAIEYSARFIHFYKVIKIVGRTTVILENVPSKLIEGSYNGFGKVIPDDTNKKEKREEYRAKFSKGKSGKYLKLLTHSLYFWNGLPEDVYSD